MAKKNKKLELIHIVIAVAAIFALSQLGVMNQLFSVGGNSRAISNEDCTFDVANDTITLPCEEVEQWVIDHPWAWAKENILVSIAIFASLMLLIYLLYSK